VKRTAFNAPEPLRAITNLDADENGWRRVIARLGRGQVGLSQPLNHANPVGFAAARNAECIGLAPAVGVRSHRSSI